MNIQQFKYILAVIDSENYEDAAERCFVTQSTLSTMITRFEGEIGIKVFNRKTKPVTATKEGKVIIDRLRLVMSEIEALESTIKELKGEVSGELKIGVIPTIAPYLLPLFLSNLAKKFPELQIVVSEITTSEIENLLIKREIDIGIVALPHPHKNLVCEELYKEPFVLYNCSEQKNLKNISIDEINGDKLWLLQEGHCMRTQVDKICKLTKHKNNKEAQFKFESASMASLLNFTKSNKGVTIVPFLAPASMDREEQDKIVEFRDRTPVRSVGLVTHEHYAKKALLKILKEEILIATKNIIPEYENIELIKP